MSLEAERAPDGRADAGAWLPIARAPKDGTRILAYGIAIDAEHLDAIVWDDAKPRTPHVMIIRWVEGWYDKDVEVEPGLFRKERTLGYAYWSPNPHQFFPTHFQSLPNPPEPLK